MTRDQMLTKLCALCLEAGSLESCPSEIRDVCAEFLSTGKIPRSFSTVCEDLHGPWRTMFRYVYWAVHSGLYSLEYFDAACVAVEEIRKNTETPGHDQST